MESIEDQMKNVQEESEATREDAYPPGTVGERPGRGRSVVQSVRLPAEDFAAIEELARAADVPVSALIRGWVLAGLAEDRDATLADAVERLAADVNRVRRLAAG
jgi:predicted DNA-binding ribbon-helix-helix protein